MDIKYISDLFMLKSQIDVHLINPCYNDLIYVKMIFRLFDTTLFPLSIHSDL